MNTRIARIFTCVASVDRLVAVVFGLASWGCVCVSVPEPCERGGEEAAPPRFEVLATPPPVNVVVATPTASAQSVLTSSNSSVEPGTPSATPNSPPQIESEVARTLKELIVPLLTKLLQQMPEKPSRTPSTLCDCWSWSVVALLAAIGLACWALVKCWESTRSLWKVAATEKALESLQVKNVFPPSPSGSAGPFTALYNREAGKAFEGLAKLVEAFKS